MITGKLKRFFKKIFTTQVRGGVSLQFKNAGNDDIIILRVIIADRIHEFKSIPVGAATSPVILQESPLYFYLYLITRGDKFYFEPLNHHLGKKVKAGKLVISILIEKQEDGQKRVVMYPEIESTT